MISFDLYSCILRTLHLYELTVFWFTSTWQNNVKLCVLWWLCITVYYWDWYFTESVMRAGKVQNSYCGCGHMEFLIVQQCNIMQQTAYTAHCMCYVSSSSSYRCHGVGPLVDPFQSHISRSLFKGLPWFLLPAGE